MSKRPTVAQLVAQTEAQLGYINELEQDRIKLKDQLVTAKRREIALLQHIKKLESAVVAKPAKTDFAAVREAAAKLAKQLGRTVSKQEVLDFMQG